MEEQEELKGLNERVLGLGRGNSELVGRMIGGRGE